MALEAASSSTRGSGWAPSGLASSWECRAVQSRQARPEEAQGASWGPAKGGTLTMLPHVAHRLELHLGDGREAEPPHDGAGGGGVDEQGAHGGDRDVDHDAHPWVRVRVGVRVGVRDGLGLGSGLGLG